MTIQEKAIKLVLAERARQDAKWGEQNHEPIRWCCILSEEIGEWCRHVLENNDILASSELVQVAATALTALESCLRSDGTT